MRSAPALPAATRTLRSPRGSSDIRPIVVDQLTDVVRVASGLRSRVGDCTAEPDVVAYGIDAGGILEEIVYIRLTNTESPVDISTIVSFATFSHCCFTPFRGDRPRMWQAAGPRHRSRLVRICVTSRRRARWLGR